MGGMVNDRLSVMKLLSAPKRLIQHVIYIIIFYIFLIYQQLLLFYNYSNAKSRSWTNAKRTPTLQDLQKHVPYLKKLPLHIAFILDSDDISHMYTADLISWCMGVGIHYITLYDMKGELKKKRPILSHIVSRSLSSLFGEQAAASLDLKEWTRTNARDDSIKIPLKGDPTKLHIKTVGESAPNIKDEFFLYITSYEDGKPQIVDATKRICKAVESKQISAKDVDYKLLEHNIRVFPSLSATSSFILIPDPDFILNFDESGMTCGFMPWHTRLSEILHMGPLADITANRFIDSLYKFSSVERRYGF